MLLRTNGFVILYKDENGEYQDMRVDLPEPALTEDASVFAVVDTEDVTP